MGLKIDPYEIATLENTDPTFYATMGPYLSRREVVAELGTPVWDEDDKVWLVAHTTDNDVYGFVSVQPNGDQFSVKSLYVMPDSRGEVIGAALMHRILSLWPEATLAATATPASCSLFTTFGFEQTGTRGRYTLYILDRNEQ